MLLEMLPNHLGAAAPGAHTVIEDFVPAAQGSRAPCLSLAVLQVPRWSKRSLADLHSALAQSEAKPCPNVGGKKQAARERSGVFLGNGMTLLVWVSQWNCTHYPALSAALHK